MFKAMKEFCVGFKEGFTGVEPTKAVVTEDIVYVLADEAQGIEMELVTTVEVKEPLTKKVGQVTGKSFKVVINGAVVLVKATVAKSKRVARGFVRVVVEGFKAVVGGFKYVVSTVKRNKEMIVDSAEWQEVSQMSLGNRIGFVAGAAFHSVVNEIKYGIACVKLSLAK